MLKEAAGAGIVCGECILRGFASKTFPSIHNESGNDGNLKN